MIKLLCSLFLLSSAMVFSQTQFRIFSKTSKQPVANAAVYCDDNLLGKTNQEGLLSVKTKCRKVEILASNYEDATADVRKTVEVALQPLAEKRDNIERVIINDKSDPRALRILDELNKRAKENSPKSLDSYTFKSYSKFSIDVDKDSVDTFKDFIATRKDSLSRAEDRKFKQKEKEKKDSLLTEEFISAAAASQMFLWEKASEYKYSKKFGEKTNIIDNRMSGFKNPIYEALAINISNLDRTPRQLRPENRNLFNFYLSDTIQLDGRKTYVIKFKEITNKKKQNPRKFNGKIYVDASSFALKKFESTSKKLNEGNIVSVWKPIDNKWFLDYEDIKVKMGDQTYETSKKDSTKAGEKPKFNKKTFGNYLYVKNRFFDFRLNEDEKASDFKGYSLELKNSDGSLLNQYRTDSLTERESATYTKMDQFVEKHQFEKKLSYLTQLLRGNIRYKMIDFDLTKFYSYDQYQGLRLGAGVKLNEKFSKTWSPDGYFGYGFKDSRFKYGLGLDVKLSDKRTSVFRIDYVDDVFAVGRFSNAMWDLSMKLSDINIDLHNGAFYKNQKWGASYLYDLSNSLSMKIAVNKEKQQALFDYQYKDMGNRFDNFSTTLSLKFAPNDKNIMTPSGKFTFEKGYPQVYVNYEKGMKALGGDLNYNRLDALIIHQFRTAAGLTNIKFFGGLSSGTAPIWKNFEIAGQTDRNNNHWYSNIGSPTNLGFTTMPAGTFYTDKFVAVRFSQSLPFKFKTLGTKYSSIDIEYQSAIGNFRNSGDHQRFEFMVLDHYYQEAGLIWNRFLGTNFGIGFSYRLGYYRTSEFSNNFGIKIKFNVLDR
ncbi:MULTISPECIES: DUF5686 family protein [Chryseobacterium]|uniref:Carboxypeptidase-like regulatory domain-containing protein n=1 Tax=Chryseobacterium camelliae TaxID=1265445 RepID=A0ABU0TEN6_9FLAO|nr:MULTISPECIES: DUF5686 family protein [Chryseobacterium]MDT3406768.1 hypothetical protein [Pseudacidovorax intermedius]MDQ1095436.1 hypothetical protein [Chryseobacterium camelliae]MDQ1099376.1 hypothetical protein [Chryseobacterium sp. SORGH_AS_1048]MDR6086722.1 hypothetical protein [Chryseobacterium sp. SORGH_AS_0909]MDR6131094.1 hypothetical protein [Chryseobacterium sp. SORGH_AS_1175]